MGKVKLSGPPFGKDWWCRWVWGNIWSHIENETCAVETLVKKLKSATEPDRLSPMDMDKIFDEIEAAMKHSPTLYSPIQRQRFERLRRTWECL